MRGWHTCAGREEPGPSPLLDAELSTLVHTLTRTVAAVVLAAAHQSERIPEALLYCVPDSASSNLIAPLNARLAFARILGSNSRLSPRTTRAVRVCLARVRQDAATCHTAPLRQARTLQLHLLAGRAWLEWSDSSAGVCARCAVIASEIARACWWNSRFRQVFGGEDTQRHGRVLHRRRQAGT
jgi:hypothetical protein